jgi:integrase
MARKRKNRNYRINYQGKKVDVDYSLLKKLKESLTFKEVQILIDACETLEEKALVELAVSTGIRREDIVNLEINRIDLENHRIVFWEEKKDRVWMVALPPEVVQTLRMYIRSLPKDQRFLFNFSGRTLYNRLQAILGRTNIRKHIPFHGLRRTYIRLSKRMGRDTRFVMDQTGDSARVILEEYEGYTIDEMVDIMKEDNIIRRARETRSENDLSISKIWWKSEIRAYEGTLQRLDKYGIS